MALAPIANIKTFADAAHLSNMDFHETVQQFSEYLAVYVLQNLNDNQTAAADYLGISRKTLCGYVESFCGRHHNKTIASVFVAPAIEQAL